MFLNTFTHEHPGLLRQECSTPTISDVEGCTYRHATRKECLCIYTRVCCTRRRHTHPHTVLVNLCAPGSIQTMSPANCSCLLQSHASFQHASVPTVVLWLLPDSPPRKARLSVLLQDGRHEAEVDGAVRDGHVSFGQEPEACWLWLPDLLRVMVGSGFDAHSKTWDTSRLSRP